MSWMQAPHHGRRHKEVAELRRRLHYVLPNHDLKAAFTNGNFTTKLLPFPGTLSTSIVP